MSKFRISKKEIFLIKTMISDNMTANEGETPNETISTRNPSVMSTLSNRGFLKLYIGQFISNLGSGMTLIVLPLFIFYYTRSYTWLGIITVMQLFPVLVFSPTAGVFTDTHNRKTIMIISDLLNAIFILIIPIIITFDGIITHVYVLDGIALMVFSGATINRFFMPARESSIPKLVKPKELNVAVSISQTTFQFIMVLAPILGAGIATVFNFQIAFILDGLSFLFSACRFI